MWRIRISLTRILILPFCVKQFFSSDGKINNGGDYVLLNIFVTVHVKHENLFIYTRSWAEFGYGNFVSRFRNTGIYSTVNSYRTGSNLTKWEDPNPQQCRLCGDVSEGVRKKVHLKLLYVCPCPDRTVSYPYIPNIRAPLWILYTLPRELILQMSLCSLLRVGSWYTRQPHLGHQGYTIKCKYTVRKKIKIFFTHCQELIENDTIQMPLCSLLRVGSWYTRPSTAFRSSRVPVYDKM